jgi:hypothetical protein
MGADTRKPDSFNRKHHDVFISYAQLDKPIADAICAKLESRKIRCWIAPRDVPPAKEFPAAIIEGIEESQFLVLVFSSHANNSPHVIRELTNAVNKGRIIVPFRVEDVMPSKSMEYLISVPHWLDAITPPLEYHIDKLADSLENLLVSNRKSPSCPHCGAELPGSIKFCTSCGAPLDGEKPAPVQSSAAVPPSPQHPAKTPDTGHAQSAMAAPAVPEPETPAPPPPPPPVKTPDKEPEKTVPPVPASPEPKTPEPSFKAAATAQSPKKTVWIAGAVVLAIVILAALFILPGNLTGKPDESKGTGAVTMQAPVATGTIDYRSEEAPINLVTLTAEPTQVLPKEQALYIEVSKDPTNALITVQYNGGPGGKVVQANSVILTRSDGTVEAGTLDFSQRLSEITLQGTRGTDRIQVIVDMGTGKLTPVVDQLLSLRVRNIN